MLPTPIYGNPLYKGEDVDAYFDGLAGDYPKGTEYAMDEELITNDSRSVSHIEHSSPVRSIRDIHGRKAWGPVHEEEVSVREGYSFGSMWDVAAQKMLLRKPIETMPMPASGPPRRPKTMVRDINSEEAENVIISQRDQITSLASTMCALEQEKITMLVERETQLKKHQIHLRNLQQEKETTATTLKALSEQVKQCEGNWQLSADAGRLRQAEREVDIQLMLDKSNRANEALRNELVNTQIKLSEIEKQSPARQSPIRMGKLHVNVSQGSQLSSQPPSHPPSHPPPESDSSSLRDLESRFNVKFQRNQPSSPTLSAAPSLALSASTDHQKVVMSEGNSHQGNGSRRSSRGDVTSWDASPEEEAFRKASEAIKNRIKRMN